MWTKSGKTLTPSLNILLQQRFQRVPTPNPKYAAHCLITRRSQAEKTMSIPWPKPNIPANSTFHKCHPQLLLTSFAQAAADQQPEHSPRHGDLNFDGAKHAPPSTGCAEAAARCKIWRTFRETQEVTQVQLEPKPKNFLDILFPVKGQIFIKTQIGVCSSTAYSQNISPMGCPSAK